MQDEPKLSPETVAGMAEELLGVSLEGERREAIAGLISALLVDMALMRAMDVGDAEPAGIYDAGRP